jgi:cytosine/adenosine deaminase-related metal-dependent hydrolase
MDLVVTGMAVTFDEDRRIEPRAAIYIHDGRIEAVQPVRRRRPAGFESAQRVSTGGIVTPGLMDLHSHLAYNTLPLWVAPRTTPYQTRYQWPGAVTYGRDISNPAQALGIVAAAATLRYAEVKAIVGGVTAIQGSPPLTRAFPGWMVRNVEKDPVGGRDTVRQSVLKVEPERLDSYAAAMGEGRSFFYHLAEGTAAALRSEYRDLAAHGCAGPNLIGIHSTALTRADYSDWSPPGAIVWSPFSNIWLYGATTDVLAARDRGQLVCLGSDWAPSGTRSLLWELKVADIWNREELGGALSDRDLVELATRNPGLAMERAWHVPVGRIVEGALADLTVHGARHADPYRSLISAREPDIKLVVVGGRPVYGLVSQLRAAGTRDIETIVVAGRRRGIVMTLPDELLPENPVQQREANMSWAEGLAVLLHVSKDPAAAVREARLPVRGGERLQFVPDMPAAVRADGQDDSRALDDDELATLVVPEPEPLATDRAWLDFVDNRAPAHARILAKLGAYLR